MNVSSLFKIKKVGFWEGLAWIGGSAVALASLKLFHRYVQWLTTPLNKLPGPRGQSFLFGVFPQIRKEPFMAPHKRWIAEAGPSAKLIHYTTMFGRSNLLVLDKDIVKQILTAPAGKKNNRFMKILNMLKNIVGEGLVILDGEKWLLHRKIIQPAFSTGLLRDALQATVPRKVNQLIEYWKKAGNREIDAHTHFAALTLDIIGPVAFSHEFHGLEAVKTWCENQDGTQEPELNDPFVNAITKAFKFDLLSTICLVFDTPSFDAMRAKKRLARKFLDAETDKIVAEAMETHSFKTPKTKSVLTALIDAQDSQKSAKLTMSELRDEVKMFMLAGHETTSTWCYWVVYALSKNLKIQEKVHDDVSKYSPGSDGDICAEHVEKMDYLRAFLQEVLRLYPPAGFIPRITRFREVLDGVTVPPSTRVIVAPHLLHRHGKYWDDPESFLPERWLSVSEEEAARRRFAFLPFSLGGRNCIGQYFATLEAQLIVAALVRAFRFEIASSQRELDHTFTSFVTMKSKPLLRFVVHERMSTRIEI